MVGIKLKLLHGVKIELAVGSLPCLARIPSRSPQNPLGYSKYLLGKRGCYKHANPFGLRLNPTRGLPITGCRIWGPFKQTNKHWTGFLGLQYTCVKAGFKDLAKSDIKVVWPP